MLTQELGRPVTVAELWQGRAADSPVTLPADVEVDRAWSQAGTLGLLDDWITAGLLDRRVFLGVSGSALRSIAAGYLSAESGALTAALEGDRVSAPLLEQIEQSIPHLQRLDDAAGGGAHLNYVGAQFRAVALLLRQGSHSPGVEHRLYTALAEIGQLAGWMAFDGGKPGLAQRYFFTALKAAHAANYRAMAAHVLADLAFQAATVENPGDAVELGEMADHAAHSTPSGVRASVRTRLAYAYAVAVRLDSFDRAYRSAIDVLGSDGGGENPAWMYYLTPNHLDTQAGYALVHAGTLASDDRNQSAAAPLLRRGERLLRDGAHAVSPDHPSQRRALFEGAWLTVATTYQGNHEKAWQFGQVALTRTQNVHSVRSLSVLSRLGSRLRRAQRNEYARSLSAMLDRALPRVAGTKR
nr:hypothetical protein [Amycolatopsis anabasis]